MNQTSPLPRPRRRRIVTGLVIGLAATVALAACASPNQAPAGTPNANGSGSAGASGSVSSTNVLTGITGVPTLEEMYKGFSTSPPDSGPKPQPGKNVWMIPCSSAASGCLEPTLAAQEAAKHLGWNFTIADGKYNQGGAYATAINNAIAAKADGLVLVGIDCEQVKTPLRQALNAGIKVTGFGGVDCPDEPLWNAPINFSDSIPNTDAFEYVTGQVAALYMINKTGGNAKLITMTGSSERLLQLVDQGFNDAMKQCAGCEVVADIPYAGADLTPNGPWITALRAALVKHPEANAVYMPWDVCLADLGGAKAVKDAGLNAIVFGGQGNASGLDLIDQGLVAGAPAAYSPQWVGWAALDTLNRAFNGEGSVSEGIGYTLVDDGHNQPPAGQPYSPSIDWQSAYLKTWGVS